MITGIIIACVIVLTFIAVFGFKLLTLTDDDVKRAREEYKRAKKDSIKLIIKKKMEQKYDYVLSIEQMNSLKELGLDISDASMVWEYKGHTENGTDWYNLEILDYPRELLEKNDVPTYHLQDILEKYPKEFSKNKNKFLLSWNESSYEYSVKNQDGTIGATFKTTLQGKSILNVAYEMLVWFLKNKLV